jgi:hypothetical protein
VSRLFDLGKSIAFTDSFISSNDESDCSDHPQPNVQLRLAGGKTASEGRVEVRAFNYPFGGICDDGFQIEEANVICRCGQV